MRNFRHCFDWMAIAGNAWRFGLVGAGIGRRCIFDVTVGSKLDLSGYLFTLTPYWSDEAAHAYNDDRVDAAAV
jgi:hypothetical protein